MGNDQLLTLTAAIIYAGNVAKSPDSKSDPGKCVAAAMDIMKVVAVLTSKNQP